MAKGSNFCVTESLSSLSRGAFIGCASIIHVMEKFYHRISLLFVTLARPPTTESNILSVMNFLPVLFCRVDTVLCMFEKEEKKNPTTSHTTICYRAARWTAIIAALARSDSCRSFVRVTSPAAEADQFMLLLPRSFLIKT